jgi:hypothetical protein
LYILYGHFCSDDDIISMNLRKIKCSFLDNGDIYSLPDF